MLLLGFLKKQLGYTTESSYKITKQIDKLHLLMAIGYIFCWFVSAPFFRSYWDDPSYGGFFDHMGVLAFWYTLTAATTFLVKEGLMPSSWNVISYASLAFLLSYPIFEMSIAGVIAIVAGFVFRKNWGANFITGALVGYWILLLILSLFTYDSYTSIFDGFIPFIFGVLGILFNSLDSSLYIKGFTWFGFIIPILFGFLFVNKFNSYQVKTEKKSKLEERNKKVFEEIEQEVKRRFHGTPKSQTETQDSLEKEKEKEKIEDKQKQKPIKTKKTEDQKKERESKNFFEKENPTTKRKVGDNKRSFGKWIEEKMRKLSR